MARISRIRQELSVISRKRSLISAAWREIAEIKKQNEARPDTHDYSEAETRDYFIDLLLKESGWALDKREDREFPVSGMPNNKEAGAVDYVEKHMVGTQLVAINESALISRL